MKETKEIYDLKALKKFNPAIIYAFEPENSFNPAGAIAHVVHLANQFHDLLNGYLYAENTILPAIEQIGIEHISRDQILKWLDELHLRIANTLARDQKVTAGEYSKNRIARLRIDPEKYMSFLKACYQLPTFSQEALEKTAEACDLENGKHAAKIIWLIKNLSRKKNCSDEQALESLLKDYDAHTLNSDDKNTIDKIYDVCMHPSHFKKAMETFADGLNAALKACDKKNIEDVAQLISKTFLQITTIHPYFNGNGRLATCFCNSLLVAMGYKSILMRNPNERFNANSSYRKAFDNIQSQPELFHYHVKERLIETQNDGGYQNESFAKVNMQRVAIADLLFSIQQEFPTYDSNKLFEEARSMVPEPPQDDNYYENILVNLEKALQKIKQVHLSLINMKRNTEFLFNETKQMCSQEFQFNQKKSTAELLNQISQTLIYIDQNVKQVDECLKTFDENTLTDQMKQKITDAQNLMLQVVKNQGSQAPSFFNVPQEEITKNDKHSGRTISAKELALNSFFINEVRKSSSIEQFYVYQLHLLKEVCIKKKLIFHMMMLSVIEKAKNDKEDLHLLLRKIVVMNPHDVVIENLLQRGADPLVRGRESGKNAVDRAKESGFTALVELLQIYAQQEPSFPGRPRN